MKPYRQSSQEQQKPKLSDQPPSAALRCRYILRTVKAYVQWIKRFIPYRYERHPVDMGSRGITKFLSHPAMQNVAASVHNQALSAMAFLYKAMLHGDSCEFTSIIWSERRRKLHVVLTRDEAKVLLSNPSGNKWIMANLPNGTGLRLVECLRLRVEAVVFNHRHDLQACQEQRSYGFQTPHIFSD